MDKKPGMTFDAVASELQSGGHLWLPTPGDPQEINVYLVEVMPNGSSGRLIATVTFYFTEGVLASMWLCEPEQNSESMYAAVLWLKKHNVNAVGVLLSCLAAGIRTPGGFEEVRAGAPVEWVRAYGQDR